MSIPRSVGRVSLSVALAGLVMFSFGGCRSLVTAVDRAIAELARGIDSFEKAVGILEGLQTKLDDGTYKNQVSALIEQTRGVAQETVRTAGQTAENTYKAALDFTRTRLGEDLRNLKRSILGQPLLERVPILTNAQSPTINFKSATRESVTIVGWNLDVAEANPRKYFVAVWNANGEGRIVNPLLVSYQGEYAVTIDVSNEGGVPLQYGDKKLTLEGYEKPFQLSITKSRRPDPPGRTSLHPSVSVSTRPRHAKKRGKNDDDVGSDDWTWVQVSYQLRIGSSKKRIEARIVWHVKECNKHKRANDTHLTSTKDWHEVWPLKEKVDWNRYAKILSIDEGKRGKASTYFSGKYNKDKKAGFPNTGGLRDIALVIDGGGGGDRDDQRLDAKLKFKITLLNRK